MFGKQNLTKSFTIVELLTIIAVILILATIAFSRVGTGTAKSRDSKRVAEVNAIRKAIQMYYLDHNEYPEQDDVWCSVEGPEVNPECTNLNTKIAPYLSEIPGDPLYGKGKEPSGILYSYQYITTNGGSEYKIHTDLETKEDPYEVYSLNGKAIVYVPPSGGGGGSGAIYCINKTGSTFVFDPVMTWYKDVVQIDATHYLVPYIVEVAGPDYDGWAAVLEVDGSYNISLSSALFEFASVWIKSLAISEIDSSHYLVAYSGQFDRGYAIVLEVDGSYNISAPSPAFMFDSNQGTFPAITQIDPSHYLVAYSGPDVDGYAVVLEVDGSYNISKPALAFEFDGNFANFPAISKIDSSHYLIPYIGPDYDGWATVLEVDGSYNISAPSTNFEFDSVQGNDPAISKIDNGHYLIAYQGSSDNGYAIVLEVDGSYNISAPSPAFEFDANNCGNPAISQIMSPTRYLVSYDGPDLDGWATILEVDGSYNISAPSPAFEFDTAQGDTSAISKIDSEHFLVPYSGPGYEGSAAILEIGICP